MQHEIQRPVQVELMPATRDAVPDVERIREKSPFLVENLAFQDLEKTTVLE